MEQRQLGDSGLYTSAIGFGTWEMSTTMYGHIDVDEAAQAVHAAIDHGITLFDTAEVYGPYHSERLLAKALGNRRGDIVLVSKVGFQYDEDNRNAGRNSSYDHVIARTESCLQRLETDYLDLLLIHWPDHDTPFEETMSALNKLKEDGKIRHYGVSNFTPEMMAECERYGHLAANQVGYNMFDRRMESAVLPFCAERNIGFMAYGTLGFGLLSGAFTPETAFGEGDWRSRGVAFGLPLFQPEEFALGVASCRATEGNCRRSRQERRATGHRLDDRTSGGFRRTGRSQERVGVEGERRRRGLEAGRRNAHTHRRGV